MIVCYQIDYRLYSALNSKLNERVLFFKDYNKCIKFVKGLKSSDKLIVFNYQNGVDVLNKNKTIKAFPDKLANRTIKRKELQNDFFKTITGIEKFTLNRFFTDIFANLHEQYSLFLGGLVEKVCVLKVGDEHQGKGKYLIHSFAQFMRSLHYDEKMLEKYSYSFMLEEFVGNARSIRIIKIKNEIFITEQVNDNWLKNVVVDESFEEIVWTYNDRQRAGIKDIDLIIKTVNEISEKIGSDFIGVDFVINDKKTGLLEINDMIGLPDNDFVYEAAIDYFVEWCK